MHLKIPQAFLNKLDSKDSVIINTTISKFEIILRANRLDFFPEFTDHGLEHIQNVLNATSDIITNESYDYLNSKDITVLIISVILHDVGMHLSPDGLKKLLSEEYNKNIVTPFDKKNWKQEWDEFYREAKRFNDQQLLNIFGTTNISFEEPIIDNLNEYSTKLYGEFIRRYHHRLAHEIAINGFPTSLEHANIQLGLEDNSDNKYLLDIGGLIARSHGMSIRDTFDYLRSEYQDSWKSPYDIKIIFLMVVLRISDYIQIDSERASKILLKVRRLKNPKSQQEWEKHNAVEHVSTEHDDPERIFVTCKPKNSHIFLELEQLFKDIQLEFDMSWAILGEAYGRHSKYKDLKIKYRRIKSNIDDKVKYAERSSFVPEKVFF